MREVVKQLDGEERDLTSKETDTVARFQLLKIPGCHLDGWEMSYTRIIEQLKIK